jgi:hypothetical protein
MFVSKVRAYLYEGYLLYGRLLVSHTKIKLGLKGLLGTNTLAYYKHPAVIDSNSFFNIELWG